MTRDKFVMLAVIFGCFVVLIAEHFAAASTQQGPSVQSVTDAKIASACIPSEFGERRVVEYRIDNDGKEVLVITAQKYIGKKKETTQYAVIAESELRP